jgi:hypothetical protein
MIAVAGTDAPPLVPDAPTARRWAVDELSKGDYGQQHASLLRRLWDWFTHLFSGTDVHGLPAGWAAVGVVALVLVVAAVALLIAGPVRRTARARASHLVHADDARSAADEAAAAGDWNRAVVERFRALVRSLEERAVLDEQAGRTADEAARAAGAALPACADDLGAAARWFDDVLYGDATAGPDADAFVRDVDARVRVTRATQPATVPTPVSAR